jgi:hypothetical protein
MIDADVPAAKQRGRVKFVYVFHQEMMIHEIMNEEY